MNSGGMYYPRKVPHGGYIDIDWSVDKVEAFIRAMHFPPHKGAIMKQGNMEIEINSIREFEKLGLS
jgi:methionyl-tRNA formyltransferase